MDNALGSETESIPVDGHVTGKAAVEIFGHRFREARIDAPTKRLSNLDVLARDAKWHDRPPMTAGRRSRPRARALAPAHALVRFPRTQFAAENAAIQYHRRCVRRPRLPQATSASPAAAVPTRQFASPPDTLRPFAGRCRFPPRAVFPRWYRRTARSRAFQRRSAA